MGLLVINGGLFCKMIQREGDPFQVFDVSLVSRGQKNSSSFELLSRILDFRFETAHFDLQEQLPRFTHFYSSEAWKDRLFLWVLSGTLYYRA
jgi:hypothetical protein